MDHTIQADIELFPNNPEKFQPNQERPSWKEPPILAKYFPMSKKAVSNNPAEAQSLYNKISHAHYKTSTRAYTDGSLNNSTERTKLSSHCPNYGDGRSHNTNKRNFRLHSRGLRNQSRNGNSLVGHLEAQVEELTMFRTLDLLQSKRETRDSYRLYINV